MKKNPRLQKNVNDKFDIDITKYQNEEEQEQDISMSSWLNFIKLSFFTPRKHSIFKKIYFLVFLKEFSLARASLTGQLYYSYR
jgi:hypothetical protein